MTALIRLIFFVLLAELMFYLLLRIYIRSLKRERLENEWDRRHPERSGPSAERREFARRAMSGFDKTLKSRLLALVFVVPNIAIAAIVYYVNWQ